MRLSGDGGGAADAPPVRVARTHELGGRGLSVEELEVRLATGSQPILDRVSLSLGTGEVVGLRGRTGSGKTTLLHSVAGLLPWLHEAVVEGEVTLDGDSLVELDPAQRAHLLATCLDRPDAQLFLATPRHELAAARRLHPGSPLADLVVESLELGPLLDRRTLELSSGERQRLALAVALVAAPHPILLDEPTANLDRCATSALVGLLDRLRDEGGAALVVEQAGWRLADAVSRWERLEDARLRASAPPASPELPPPRFQPGARVVLAARGLAVARGGPPVLDEVELELHEGEIVLLTGPNGAGKTTLAEVLAGCRRPAKGELEVAGRTALMLPDAELQLFGPTVAAEVAAAGGGEAEARVLRRHGLERLAARAPWTLSRGERQQLVHAVLDLVRPELMVVDEPAQGLDPVELARLVGLIQRRAEKGRAYLVISHREELAGAAHRTVSIRDRRLAEAGQA